MTGEISDEKVEGATNKMLSIENNRDGENLSASCFLLHFVQVVLEVIQSDFRSDTKHQHGINSLKQQKMHLILLQALN